MNNIDERVVAMRFDNNQFERGVRTSMRSLEELKEKSNLDDVASSIGESMSSINDTLNFKSPTKSAGIFSKALTSMGKVAKYAFKSLTSPLRVLSNSLQTLGKYTRTMFGIDLANDIVNAGKQIVRAFTIDPLRTGWSEYELKMDSIKTIMSGSGESLETVKAALEELNTYADQTIYSFSDMTSNIGKFTNNGVKLEDAVTAMKGISNAAADAGQGTNQASMAMYNLSQAISMGKLTTIDWKSIENANMATLKFKQTIIDAGVAMGQLKKEGDKYYTTSADKSEVTAENFRNTLEKGWATTDVLLTALKVYSGELNAVELAALGFDLIPDDLESDAYRLEKLGQEAYSAAIEVRTFTKMMDALKEAAQSGWAMTFEYIFGDMQEATDLWTQLNNRFDKILSAQTESRNDILKGWRGFKKQWSEDGKSFEWIPIEGAEDGREILIEGFNNLLDTVQSIAGLVGDAWKNVFGELTSDKLLTFTKRFTDFTKKFKSWLNSGNQNGTRLEKIRKGLEGIFSVFKTSWTSIKNTFNTIVKTLHLDQVFDLALDGFATASEWLTDIGGKISKLWEDIGGNQVLENLSNWFGDLWANIGKFFTEPDEATGKTGFLSWWDGMISDLEAKWTKLQATDFYKAATTLGTNLWENIFGFFQPKERYDEKGIRLYDNRSPFQEMLDSLITNISEKWTTFKGTDFYKTVSNLGANLWSNIFSFFQPKERYDERGIRLYDSRSPFQEMLDSLITNISEKWTTFCSVFDREDGTSVLDILRAVFDRITSIFKPVEGLDGKTEAPIVTWLKGAWESIKAIVAEMHLDTGFNSLLDTLGTLLIPSASAEETPTGAKISIPEIANQIKQDWSQSKEDVEKVGEEVNNAIETITSAPDKLDEVPDDKGVLTWFQGLGNGISSAWNFVAEKITSISDDVKKVSDSVSTALTNFITWVSTVDWDEVLTKAEGHFSSLATIFTIFSTGKFISGAGSFLKSGGKIGEAFGSLLTIFGKDSEQLSGDIGKTLTSIGQNLGDGVKNFLSNVDTTKKLGAMGDVMLSFAASLGIITGVIYGLTWIVDNTKPETLTEALSIFSGISVVLGLFAMASTVVGVSSKQLGYGILALSGAILLILHAISSIANMKKKGTDFSDALGVLDKLVLLIGAFEAFSTMDLGLTTLGGLQIFGSFGKNKKTGLIGFAVAIEGMVLAVKQIAEVVGREDFTTEKMQYVLSVVKQLAVLVGAFSLLSSLSFGGVTSEKNSWLFSLGGESKSGLIGFAVAIEGMVLAVKQLASLPETNIQKGVDTISAFTGMINSFEVFKGIGNFLGTWNGAKNSTGLLGFVAAITAFITETALLASADPTKLQASANIIEQFGNMISKFEIFRGAGSFLGNVSGVVTKGTKILELGELVTFIGGITALFYALTEFSGNENIDVSKMESLVGIINNLGDMFVRIGAEVGGLTAIFAAIGPSGALTAVETIGVLFGGAGLLAALFGAADWIIEKIGGDGAIETWASRIESMGSIFVALAGVFGDIVGAFTQKVGAGVVAGQISGELQGTMDAFKDVDEEDLDHLEMVMRAMNIMANNLPDKPNILERWFGKSQTLSDFANSIGDLGGGLKRLSDGIGDIENFDQVTSGITAIGSLLNAAFMLEALNKFTGTGAETVGNLFDFLWQMGDSISGYDVTTNDIIDKLGGFRSFAEDMNAGIQLSAESITIDPIIMAITDQLNTSHPEIVNAIHNLFTDWGFAPESSTTLTPVVDDSNLEDMPFLFYQNGNLMLDGTVKIDSSSLDGVVSAINTQGFRIVGAINGLGGKIDTLHSAMSQMQLVLDTGAVAGAVSSNIQKSSAVYRRVDIRDTSGGR